MIDPYVIEMTNDGQGSTEVVLGDALVTIITRFNYSVKTWTMDIVDVQGDAILTGLMMVPNIDMLYPYPEQKALLGGLVLIEKDVGDHLSDGGLGSVTKLLWFPPGTEVAI